MKRIVVDASQKSYSLGLRELVEFRDLFLILAYRDIRVRYAQTLLGLAWAAVQPLATVLVFTIIFGVVARVDTGGTPYVLFAMSGLVPWSYFSFVVFQSGTSIISAQEMVKKVYFPRLVIPLSKAIVGFVDFAVSFLFLIVLMLYYQYDLTSRILFLPLFILLTVFSSLAVGIWLSALTIRYRDFQHVVPFMVQIGLYVTPVGYRSADVLARLPEWAGVLYFLNPMAGVVEGFRWSLLGGLPPSPLAFVSFLVVAVLFVSGLYYFRTVERTMADLV